MKSIFFLFLVASLALSSAQVSLRLASLFTDHMVLQQDLPVPVWGWADAGAEVTVIFKGKVKKVKADGDGVWHVELEPLEGTFESAEMEVTSSSGERVILRDVVVGEVWICSGQSNMHFSYRSVPELKPLASKAEHIRSFEVGQTVAFEEQDECKGKWKQKIPNSAVGFGFAYYLQEQAKAPVGIILSAWGSSSIEAWMPRDMVETVPHFNTIMAEFDADDETRKKLEASLNGPKPWSRPEDIFMRRQPNILYNAMMKPLAPVACRGVVWYQGERNTQSMEGMLKEPWFSRNSGMRLYADTLKKWIQRYRQEWGREDLEFMIVMLPRCFGKPLPTGPQKGAEHPTTHSWAWIRESQLSALDLPHTAVVNTIDLGDLKNLHPRDKEPIGKRLALLASKNVLGKEVVAQGPVSKEVLVKGDALVISFENAEGLKTTDGKSPAAFWLADDDENWVQAEAQIEDETVVLRSDELEEPRYIRYAFAGFPQVNLVNGSGLPAYPFRTDQFQP